MAKISWPSLHFDPINLWSVWTCVTHTKKKNTMNFGEVIMSTMNRSGNSANPHQGKTKRVLCVCSAGLLRSPTAAVVLSQEPFNYNTRAVGITEEYALIPVEKVLIEWADEVVVMESWMAHELEDCYPGLNIICLNIEDNYPYRDRKLMELIATNYKGIL